MSEQELSPTKRALLEVRRLRARLAELEQRARQPVALVGMGCRFPGASDPRAFWDMLVRGDDAIVEVPTDRWDAAAYYDPDSSVPGKMSTRWGGFLSDIDGFDAGFFGISPREAERMDPQQRLLLEVAWEALEDAGIAPDRLAGRAAGVFVGIAAMDYGFRMIQGRAAEIDAYLPQGMALSAASGRLAYTLGLRGPAVSVDTACSSSLYAVHLALQSLRQGECELALAAGVNAMFLPELLVAFSKAGMMAADGRCKTFDARADGYVRGEGCGVLVLKRLGDALDAGDRIYAVLKGSAANQDGRTSGLSAPSRAAQEEVLRSALADAGVSPADVAYIEAHGTGTALGDPIEVGALAAVLSAGRQEPLRIGSVKTNVGHLEAAAGVAALIKAALAVHHGQIPASLHFTEPNPRIPWREIPVRVADRTQPFPVLNGARVAGVSSFGFTGTNVHVLLTDAPPTIERVEPVAANEPRLLKLSARTPTALRTLAAAVAERCRDLGDADFAAFCTHLDTGRADLRERLSLQARSGAAMAVALTQFCAGEEVEGLASGTAAAGSPDVAMLFTGHGAQRPGMLVALADRYPVVREALAACDAHLQPALGVSLFDVLRAPPEHPLARALLEGMTLSQPVLFAAEYALHALWRSWGVHPTLVLGHSVGEYVAATVAGVMDLEGGLRLVSARGRLMDALPGGGAMLAVFATEAEVRAAIGHDPAVQIAVINGPTEIVISGTRAGIEDAAAALVARAYEVRRLAVATAAHSALLDPILDELEAVAASVSLRPPELALVSCTTGRLVDAGEVTTPGYWRRHLRETVRFHDALRTAASEGYRVFVEAGPHPVLCGLGRRAIADDAIAWVPSLRDGRADEEQILESAGAFWAAGGALDWQVLGAGGGCTRTTPVPAPTYPWEHRSYLLEAVPPEPAHADSAERRWTRALTTGRTEELRGPLDFRADLFPARWTALDRLTTAIVRATVARLAGGDVPATHAELAEFAGRAGVVPPYHTLLARWLDRLARNLLAGDAQDELEQAWADAERVLSHDGAFLAAYARRCARALPDVVRGLADPLDTLFPDGSTETADQLYRDWNLVRYYNQVLGAVFRGILDGAGRPLRILEVGAGTGGTTASLLPEAEGRVREYLFTDVSAAFLEGAETRFGSHACIRFGTLDLNRDAAEQGFRPGTFDVVVAANVLHATRDLPQTLRTVASLLAPGGLLLALEITRYHSWFDVTTALLEGWESFQDELRREHPVLDLRQWSEALGANGFARSAAFPAAAEMEEIGFHVLLAQTPGEVAGYAEAPATEAAPGATASTAAPGDLPFARLLEATPEEQEDLLVELVRGQIARMLRLSADQPIGRNQRLMDLGLDSLMAVELRGRLNARLPLAEPLSSTLIFDHPTIDAIVALIRRRLRPGGPPEARPAAPAAPAPADPEAERRAANIAILSEESAEALLLERLDALEEDR